MTCEILPSREGVPVHSINTGVSSVGQTVFLGNKPQHNINGKMPSESEVRFSV